VRSLPLKLLSDDRLRRIIRAYGSIYMLGALDNYFNYEKRGLIKAHRNFTGIVSQYYYRSDKWDKSKNLFDNTNTSIYGRIKINKFEDEIPRIKKNFLERFENYVESIRVS